jgi:hypothetical protein
LMDINVGLDQAIIPADERAEVKKIAAAAFAEGVCEGDSREYRHSLMWLVGSVCVSWTLTA